MPTLSIKVVATASLTNSKTISQGDLDRFTSAYRFAYTPQAIASAIAALGPNASASAIASIQATNNAMSNSEVFNAWANGLFQGTVNNVKSIEQQQASQVAIVAVTSVDLS